MESLRTQKADLEKRLAEHDAKESENATKVSWRSALPHALWKRYALQLSTYDENMNKLRSVTNNLRQQLGASNSEKSNLNRTLADLQAELKSAVAERDALRAGAGAGAGAEASKELAGQLESLRQEKAVLEKALADEKASKGIATPSPDQSSVVVGSHILAAIRAC